MSVTVFPPVLGYTARGGPEKPVTGPGPFFGGGCWCSHSPSLLFFPRFLPWRCGGVLVFAHPPPTFPKGHWVMGGPPGHDMNLKKKKENFLKM